jgi:2-phosphosulfolactate phosphatase
MEIRINSLLDGARAAQGLVIIVDVYRAFTTAAVALAREAERIILVAEPPDALTLRRELQNVAAPSMGAEPAGAKPAPTSAREILVEGRSARVLCMGEVNGARPAGFDVGNSPFELSEADVRGCTLIQSTRAGTAGLIAAAEKVPASSFMGKKPVSDTHFRARRMPLATPPMRMCAEKPVSDTGFSRGSRTLYAAALVNAAATAQAVRREDPPLVTIVAMGWEGRERSDEDEQCALYLRNLLQGRQPDRESVRRLVLAGGESQKFGDPVRPHFHLMDREIALQIDSLPFAIRVRREEALLVARPFRPSSGPPGAWSNGRCFDPQ